MPLLLSPSFFLPFLPSLLFHNFILVTLITTLMELFLSTQSVHAQMSRNFNSDTQPRYELGMGTIGLHLPDYPGANQSQWRLIPFPWFVYRGDHLKRDDEGSRWQLWHSKHHELSLAPYFHFPVESTKDSPRHGMPDLDYLIGVGPRMLSRLIPNHHLHRLNFVTSLVGVSSTDFHRRFQTQGLDFQTSLDYWYLWPHTDTTLFSSFSLRFGSRNLNRYFYEVRPIHATPQRPVYKARSGLVSSSLSLGIGNNFIDNIFVFMSGSWRNFEFASNKKSSLVKSSNNVGVVLGVIWTFWESHATVQRIQE